MDGSKFSQDELVEKLKQQVALENIELLLTVNFIKFYFLDTITNQSIQFYFKPLFGSFFKFQYHNYHLLIISIVSITNVFEFKLFIS